MSFLIYVPLFFLNMHTGNVFFLRHVYKSDLNVGLSWLNLSPVCETWL